MNSVLLRSTGMAALVVSLFYGCGGRVESEYDESDSGIHESPLCGNGKLDSGEQCDGNKLNGATCGSATMNSRPNGTLSCSNRCRLDTSKCTGSGNGGTGGGPSGTGGRPNNGGRPNGTGGVLGTGGSVPTSGCTASSDCRNGQVCCGTRNGTQYAFACARTCGQNGIVAECSQASDCNRGQVCCGTTNQMGTAYSSIACARTCTATGEYPLCASNAECGQGRTCQTSQILPPAFKVCR